MRRTRRSAFAGRTELAGASADGLLLVFPDMWPRFVRLQESARDFAQICSYSTTMTDNSKAGFALIAGSVGGMLTMAIHPTNQSSDLALVSGIAHSLALLSVLLLFLGTCGLARFLGAPDRLAFSALVTYGLATVAVVIASTVSGFIVPDIMRLMTHDVPAAAPQWRIAIASIFQLNQAFSRIYSVAGAAAITLWSVCCLRQGRLSRSLALYGCLTAPVIALLILVGHLRLNVHGMTVVMVSQVIWFAGMGAGLRRKEGRSL